MAHPPPEASALERIEAARRSSATTLDLSKLGLDRLPPEIGSLTALTSLWLDNNQLSSLPAVEDK